MKHLYINVYNNLFKKSRSFRIHGLFVDKFSKTFRYESVTHLNAPNVFKDNYSLKVKINK